MKIVIAMDSFKGSLSSIEAGNAVKNGILRVLPEAEVMVKPLADGGEGTTEAVIEGLSGTKKILQVTGPLGKPVEACYGILPDGKTAVMEMAQAAGITLLREEERNAMDTTTYGVGEMIKDAIGNGCRRFIIGIGGSATNDGGIGMLEALGYSFLDTNGKPAGAGAKALSKIAGIDGSHAMPELSDCQFQIACDVTNPLCGVDGATYVYGLQKGLSLELFARVDADMKQYAHVAEAYMESIQGGEQGRLYELPGTGAAGGLGFAFLCFLKGELVPGVDLILDATGLEKDMLDADIVITGEGQLDGQTAMGKAPMGVAKLAKQYGCKVLGFAGSVTKEAVLCNEYGMDAYFPIVRGVTDLQLAMEQAEENLEETVEQVFRLIKSMS
ncbi:MAG: glycerate kinase [Lachnospiraceae bacterium]